MSASPPLSQTSDEQLANRVIQTTKKHLIPLACLLYFFNGVDRFNVGFAALGMNRELHITNIQFGTIASMFFVSYLIFQVPSNMVLQRVRVNRWIGFIVFGWGVATTCQFFAHDVKHILWCRFFVGVFEAGFFPGMVFYFTNWFPRRVQAKVVALFMMTNCVSGAIAAPISGWIVGNAHWLNHAGWRWLFFIEGVPTALFGILAWFVMTSTPKDAKWLNDEERNWLLKTLQEEKKSKAATAAAGFFHVIKNPMLWRLVGVYIFTQGASQAGNQWLPGVFKRMAMSEVQVGFVMALPYVAGLLSMPLWAGHSDKTGERKYHAAASVFLAGAAFMLMLVPSVPFKLVAFGVYGLAVYSFWGPYWALPAMLLSPEALAVGIAVINSGSSLGGLGVNYAMGYVVNRFGTPGVFAFEGILCLLSFVMAVTLPNAKKKAEARASAT